MQWINQKTTHYLTPNKTIETLSVSNQERERIFYIYNYKGVSFRVFISKEEIEGFWSGESQEICHVQTEQELDEWLESVAGSLA